MKRLFLLATPIFATLLISTHCSYAQDTNAINEVGLVSYGSYHGGDIDQVDLKSGNLFARIPLFSLPQLGKLSLSMSMVINNNGFANSTTCGTWEVDADDDSAAIAETTLETVCYPYIYRTGAVGPTLILDQDLGFTFNGSSYSIGLEDIAYEIDSVTDATGASHVMAFDVGFGSAFIERALDGSGYTYVPSSSANAYGTIFTPSGLKYDTTGATGTQGPGYSYTQNKVISHPTVNPGGTAPKITYSAGLPNQMSSGYAYGYGWQGCGSSLNVADTSLEGEIGSIASSAPEFEWGYNAPGCPNPGGIVDSLGRQIPRLDPSTIRTDSASLSTSGCPNISTLNPLANNQSLTGVQTWQVPGPNGQLSTYTFCYTTVAWSTDFVGGWGWASSPANAEATSWQEYYEDTMGQATAVQAIVLPNGTYWGFVYDSVGPLVPSSYGLSPCQNAPNSTNRCNTPSPIAYGDVLEIIRPTGGSTSYTYGMDTTRNISGCSFTLFNGPGGLQGYSSVERLVQSRTVSDVAGNNSMWTYRWQATGGLDSSDFSVVVTNPLVGARSTYVNHYFSNAVVSNCSAPEVLATTYDLATYNSSTQTAGGGTPIKSVSTTYMNNILNYIPFGGYVAGYTPLSQNFPLSVQTSMATSNGLALVQTTNYSYAPLYSEGPAYSVNAGQLVVAPTSYGTVYYEKPIATEVTGPDGSYRNTLTNYQWQLSSPQAPGSFSGPTVNILDAPAISCILASATTSSCWSVLSSAASAERYTYGDTSSPYNLASVQELLNGSWVTTRSMTHDSLGRTTSTTDANSNTTSILAFGTDPNTGSTTPFPAQIQRPLMPVEFVSYDDNTGNLLSHKDVNGNTTTYQYFDPEGRRTAELYPDGGSKTYCYTDVGGSTCSKSSPPYAFVTTTAAAPNPNVVTTALYDGLGRVVETQLNSNPVGAVYTDTSYDALGRTWCVTNPYYGSGGSSSAARICSTYDALDRKVLQTLPDSNTMQWCYNGLQTDRQANCSNANVSSVPANAWVDVTDELGHHSQQVSDALGNLRAVMEQSPTASILALETDYGYDVLGNLTSVNQRGNSSAGDAVRARFFSYDSMSRLTSACNPESLTPGTTCGGTNWSATYSYDLNGNLVSKTDNRGTTTSYSYDALNRILSKSFANSPNGAASSDPAKTPSSCYFYNTAANSTATNGIGLLGASWTQLGTCSPTLPSTGTITSRVVLAYDKVARVKKEQQCIPGSCTSAAPSPYSMGYAYDLAGNVTQSEDGLGQASWFHQYDGAGQLRLSAANTLWPAQFYPATLFSAQGTSASNQGYTPAGGLSNWMMGVPASGSAALTGSKTYDSRLRVLTEQVNGHQ